jgi:hypothetical protein
MSADVPRPPREGQDPPARRHLTLVRQPGEKPPRAPPKPAPYVFTDEEQKRLRSALKTARGLMGSWSCLASAMYVDSKTIITAANGHRPVTAGMAIRLAKALGKPLESLYAPPSDATRCAACGATRRP